jgi:hypothetical protein
VELCGRKQVEAWTGRGVIPINRRNCSMLVLIREKQKKGGVSEQYSSCRSGCFLACVGDRRWCDPTRRTGELFSFGAPTSFGQLLRQIGPWPYLRRLQTQPSAGKAVLLSTCRRRSIAASASPLPAHCNSCRDLARPLKALTRQSYPSISDHPTTVRPPKLLNTQGPASFGVCDFSARRVNPP